MLLGVYCWCSSPSVHVLTQKTAEMADALVWEVVKVSGGSEFSSRTSKIRPCPSTF